MAVSSVRSPEIFAPRRSAPPDQAGLAARIRETAVLADRRGYGVPLDDFARNFYGGPVTPDEVLGGIDRVDEVSVVDGVVVRSDRLHLARAAWQRRGSHATHVHVADRIASDFSRRLAATCPLVRCVAVSGSVSSGGFDPRDDVDFNLFVRDGSKYTVYLWSLALSAVNSLRNRGKETDEMGDLPFLPKVVCINVVWEDRQVRPFVRDDKWLAYELLMTRPLTGNGYYASVVEDNPWLGAHFPQIRESAPHAPDAPPRARPGAVLFRFLDRNPRALAAVERLARVATIGLHRAVSLLRTRSPEASQREEFVNMVKRPYSVYDVPGREGPIPPAAYRER